MQKTNTFRTALRSLTLAAQCAAIFLGVGSAFSAAASDPAVRSDVILINHVGFLPDSPKYCVIPQPPEKTFTIHRMKDCVWTPVYEGTLTEGEPELEAGWVGEFTSLQEEGIYQVRCGGRQSRCFVVWRRVYDAPMRVLYSYFPWQRCGDSLTGWAAPCHLDDGRIAETGEHRDLAGGYHQSCDLRKWISLEVIGLLGLTRFGQMQSPRWDNGCIAEELRWGSDYYQKLVREDGGMLDSVFIPLGWGPRDFYLSDSPPPAYLCGTLPSSPAGTNIATSPSGKWTGFLAVTLTTPVRWKGWDTTSRCGAFMVSFSPLRPRFPAPFPRD